MSSDNKPSLAVHKFSSCDGCQLALLNLGTTLPKVFDLVNIDHFVEAGISNEEAQVDIALVEGSVSTPEELERIKLIRANSKVVIAIGACAVSGGLQALRNSEDSEHWTNDIYQQAQFINILKTATPIADHVNVDFKIWGCPINSRQLIPALQSLLAGVVPKPNHDKVCVTCKRNNFTCVEVSQAKECLGPITNDGCGALCPSIGRACYGCFGPAQNINSEGLSQHFKNMHKLDTATISRRLGQINSNAPELIKARDNLNKTKINE